MLAQTGELIICQRNQVGYMEVAPQFQKTRDCHIINPLITALVTLNSFEPTPYDRTYILVDLYTPHTPQTHPCGSKAKSVEIVEQLLNASIGRGSCEDRQQTVSVKYAVALSCASIAMEELTKIETNGH